MFLFNQQFNPTFKRYSLHEGAITIEFGHQIDTSIALQVNSFNRLLLSKPFAGLLTTVPAYASLTVFFDPLTVIQSDSLYGIDCFNRVSNYLQQLHQQVQPREEVGGEILTIPVCYEEPFAPDLGELAKSLGRSTDELVDLHTAPTYHVYMIGFTPGFAYLGGLNPLLEYPRKAKPRKKVPAGSVGIAGTQTGLYALDTPGGWQIIGRTPLILFDPNREQASLLKAGDQVIFKPIDREAFAHYQQEEHADTDY